MPFSGTYKRISSENVDKLLESELCYNLWEIEDTFTITCVDHDTFAHSLNSGGKDFYRTFNVDEEHEIEGHEGSKMTEVVRMPRKNVLVHTITDSEGRKAEIKREFHGKKCVLTISPANSDIHAKVYYEAVEHPHEHHNLHMRFWHTTWLWNIITNHGQYAEDKHCGCEHCTTCGKKPLASTSSDRASAASDLKFT